MQGQELGGADMQQREITVGMDEAARRLGVSPRKRLPHPRHFQMLANLALSLIHI